MTECKYCKINKIRMLTYGMLRVGASLDDVELFGGWYLGYKGDPKEIKIINLNDWGKCEYSCAIKFCPMCGRNLQEA